MVVVNKDECKACEDCVSECPVEAITMVDGKAQINADTCTECETCVEVCPSEAIKVK